MIKKIQFSKLEQVCPICPSQWKYSYDDGAKCLISYNQDHLTVYITKLPTDNIIDCIKEQNLVLSVEDLLGVPECGHMTNDVLFEILTKYNFLEDK